MTLWTRIRDLITHNQVDRLADLLTGLTEEERAGLGGQMRGLVRELRRAHAEEARERLTYQELISWEFGEQLDRLANALLLAGVGLITGPAAAVTWMAGRDVNRRWAEEPNVGLVCRVAAARPPEWRREVAVRLVRRIRRPGDRLAPLAVALLRESGAEPPDHDPLVAAWLSAPSVSGDPLIPVLLPKIFTADGAGRALRDERATPLPTRWLATAARELPRDQALDGCVSRFLRGGDAQDLRFFVRLHQLLDPAPEESAPRLRDYLRLLPSSPSTVAELAAAQVRAALPIDHADLVEAVDALTFREEAKLAATGLRWLDRALRDNPETAGDFVMALTTAYAHKSFDVRNRAVELTLKHAGAFADHAGTILDGLQHLPADLAARLAERFGGEVPAEEQPGPKEFPPLPEPRQPQPFPEPTLFHGYQTGWVGRERWLAAFVAGVATDRERLRREIRFQAEQHRRDWRSEEPLFDPGDWQWAMAAELLDPGSFPTAPPPRPQRFWDSAGHSMSVRVLERGQEPPEEETFGFFAFGAHRPGRPLDDDTPLRVIRIVWTSDEGPAAAVALDGDREIPFTGGRVRLGEPERYDDSEEAMPSHVLELAYEEMATLGVDPARIAAMRAGRPVPPPGPGEPLVQVTVVFVPGRLRSYMEELSELDEWRRRNRLPHPGGVSPIHDFVLHRYAELAEALRADALPPVLLATPTWMSGHLDPDVLVDRLETCAAAGVEPLPADLAQALLRLPRGAHPGAAERAAKIDLEAAREAARWLAGDGLADPECGLVWRHMAGATMVEFGDTEPEHFSEVRLKPVLRVTAPTGHRLIDEVLLREPYDWAIDESGSTIGMWPAVLPSHREVVAVNYLPFLLRSRYWGWSVTPESVAVLGAGQGPLGEATAVILACFIAGGGSEATSLVLELAARGELPAEAIGRQLALVLRRTWRETRTAIAGLREPAEAGAHHEVWRILRALLPELWPGEGQRPTVSQTELVSFAAEVAQWAGARGEIPCVAEQARSRRTSRFARECRRLHAVLTG